MKFFKSKEEIKEREKDLMFIQAIGDLSCKIEYLNKTIRDLENRVSDLELSRRVGF